MATIPAEPRNPFYFLLLLSGLLFVVTVLAMVVVPVLENRALLMEKGGQREELLPVSVLRNRIDRDGVYWILYEVSAVIFFGLMSMFLDRLRRHRAAADPIVAPPEPPSAPADATTNIKAGELPANPTLAPASTAAQPVAAPQPAQSNKKKKKKRK